MFELSCNDCDFFVNIFGSEQEAKEICCVHSENNDHTAKYVKVTLLPHKTKRSTQNNSSKSTEFQHKPTRIEAKLFTGKNKKEIIKFTGGIAYPNSSLLTLSLPALLRGQTDRIHAEEWVLKDKNGNIETCSQWEFEANYEAVGTIHEKQTKPEKTQPAGLKKKQREILL